MRDESNSAESIFQEACDLPEAQRGPYVAARCGDNGPLRREVEALLEHERDAPAAFLTGPPAEAPAPLDEVGPRVGPYRIVRRIGEGGFGSVYLGEQESPIRREVAIKVVKLGMDTRQIVRRFEAERRTLALMSHANIARVIDAGVTERGRPYFVMEHVPGPPITEYCDTHRLDIPGRLGLFLDACAAIEHAHHKGVIHRDIKPSNILVDTVDGHAAVKVIDFGIAKALGDTRAGHTAATEPGQFVGTPEYVSPEQAVPGGDVDTRSDIYSLGVLLYRLLCGALPADRATGGASAPGPSPSAAGGGAAAPSARVRSMRGDAAGIAERRATDPRALARRLRGDLDWITLRAMDPDRARRYSSCSELAADIRRHIAGQPVMAGPPSAGYRVRKFVSRHRAGVAGAAAVVLVLVIGAAGTAWQAVRATRAEVAARNDRDAARLETRRAEAVRAFLTDMLKEAKPERAGATSLTVREAVDRAAARLDGGALKDQPEVEDAVRWALGETYVFLGARAQAAAQFEWVANYRQSVPRLSGPPLGDALYWLGSESGASGDPAKARRTIEQAAEIYRASGPGEFTMQHVLLSLGQLCLQENDFEGAVRTFRELVADIERAADPALDKEHAWAVFMLARALYEAGQPAESATTYEKARPLVDRAFEPISLFKVLFVTGYGTHALFPVGRHAETVALVAPVLESIRGAYAPDHPDAVSLRIVYARALIELGRAAEAEPILRECVEIRERTPTANSIHVFVVRSLLGHALAALGRDAEAEPLLVRAFEGIDSHHPTRRDERARALERVIRFYEHLGRTDEATAHRARRE